jgi:hypothetical protein
MFITNKEEMRREGLIWQLQQEINWLKTSTRGSKN